MSRRTAFSIIELLVVIGIISVLLAILLPAVQVARESARRGRCENHLRQMMIAINDYQATFKVYPPGGIARADWRSSNQCETEFCTLNKGRDSGIGASLFALLLDRLDQENVYNACNFRLPIRSPGNATVIGYKMSVFLCPTDSSSGNRRLTEDSDADYSGTSHNTPVQKGNYAANWGAAGADFDIQFVRRRPNQNISSRQGMFGQSSSISPTDLAQDGTSNTVALAEILSGDQGSDCRGAWALPIMGASAFASRGDDPDPDYHLTPNKLPADGSGDRIPFCPATPSLGLPCTEVSDEWPLQSLTERSIPRADPSRQGAAPRSLHKGGVHVGLADGSVRFLTDSVNAELWHAVLTIKNLEPIDDTQF